MQRLMISERIRTDSIGRCLEKTIGGLSLEQRVGHLLPKKGRKEKRCLIEIALAFAKCHDSWLTIEDLDRLMKGSGKKYSRSALYEAVADLSSSIDSLDGHSYIDKETANIGSGRPVIKGRLSISAFRKIYEIVKSENEYPEPSPRFHGLKGKGRIKISPISMEIGYERNGHKNKKKMFLLPLDNVEQKLGQGKVDRIFNSLLDNDNWATRCEKITKSHRWGRNPGNEYQITPEGSMRLVENKNERLVGIKVNITDQTLEGKRVQALEERVKKGEQAAVDKLIQVLSSDARPDARWKAAQALGRLHENRALKQLKTACNDPDEKVRNAAKNALEKIEKE